MKFERVELNSIAGVGLVIIPDPNNANEVDANLRYRAEIHIPSDETIVSESVRIDNQEIKYEKDALGHLSFFFIPRDVKTFDISATAVTATGAVLEGWERVIIRDERPPEVTILPAAGNVYDLNQSQTFHFEVKDVGGGDVADVDCALNGNAQACTFDIATGKGTLSFNNLDSGNYVISVTAADNFNNAHTEELSFSIAFDQLPPVITLSALPGNTYYTKDVQKFEYKVAEFGSGLKSVVCKLDGTPVSCATVNNVTQSLSLQPQTEGAHTLTVTATDNQNNSATKELPFQSLVDKNPPTITIIGHAGNTYLLTDPQQFNFGIQDLETGIASYSCKFNGQPLACTLGKDGTGSFTLNPTTEGVQTIVITAKDKYDNVRTETKTFNMRKDQTSPKVLITADMTNEYFINKPLKFTFTVSKEAGATPISSVLCYQGTSQSAVEIPCNLNADKTAGSFTVTESATGEKSVSVKATNTAGNLGSDSVVFNINKLDQKSTEMNVTTIKKVDVLWVVDNSGSMAEEQANLAQRVSSFVSQISGMDWRAAVTTTDLYKHNGTLLPIKNLTSKYYVDSTMNTQTAQSNLGATIQMGTGGSASEQGIAATYNAILQRTTSPNSTFFRDDAALAVIVISDENETGTGTANIPANLVSLVKSQWPSKNFSFSSIVKTDSNCLGASIGTKYMELSRLTGEGLAGGGVIGCVGDTDYTAVLSKIGGSVQNINNTLRLDCEPYKNQVSVTVGGKAYSGTYSISGSILSFSQTPPDGTYSVAYKCVTSQ